MRKAFVVAILLAAACGAPPIDESSTGMPRDAAVVSPDADAAPVDESPALTCLGIVCPADQYCELYDPPCEEMCFTVTHCVEGQHPCAFSLCEPGRRCEARNGAAICVPAS
jgi:hypothetical protein